jgi:transglutaminase-like putative cysteine protease
MHTYGNIEGDRTILPLQPLTTEPAFAGLLAPPAHLLDHRAIDWSHVTHARYWLEQSLTYSYPGPIRDLRQRLITIPPHQIGDQRVLAYAMSASAPLAAQTVEQDDFGNRLIRFRVAHIEERITFDMKVVIERNFEAGSEQYVSSAEAAPFRDPTHLTSADTRITQLAAQFQNEYATPESFAAALNAWIYATMRYGRGATTVATTAADALQIGQGLCQDYAHIMLAICRAAGYPARYVSGQLLGEGRSHAWVELLAPENDGRCRVLAFDPTNHRRTTPAYLTVAVGRDYNDVSPTSGTFTAPYPGQLHATKRAGVTHITRQTAAL